MIIKEALAKANDTRTCLVGEGTDTLPVAVGSGVDADFAEKNILFAMFMRNRYNVLDFAFRIGKLEEFAREAANPWKNGGIIQGS